MKETVTLNSGFNFLLKVHDGMYKLTAICRECGYVFHYESAVLEGFVQQLRQHKDMEDRRYGV